MKRWILYVAILAMLGNRGMDIGKLVPVETVWLTEEDGQVYLQTDSGDYGRGENVAAALENLNASASKKVFLETADYLIIEKGKEVLLQQANSVFRPSCMLCVAEKMPELTEAKEFLRAHEPEITLRQWTRERNPLPQLWEQDGRFFWIEG